MTGLTAQNYAELAALYGKYAGRGLEILGFPSNQFGSQVSLRILRVCAFARSHALRSTLYSLFADAHFPGVTVTAVLLPMPRFPSRIGGVVSCSRNPSGAVCNELQVSALLFGEKRSAFGLPIAFSHPQPIPGSLFSDACDIAVILSIPASCCCCC